MMAMAVAVAASSASPDPARAQESAPPDTAQTGSPLYDLTRQAAQGNLALPDTLSESRIGIRFTPTYINQVTGDVSSVGMRNVFQTNMTTPFGSMFNFSVSADEKHYRLQDKQDQNKQLTATVAHQLDVFTSASISFVDSRVFNRSIIPGGAVQDYVFNDQSFNASGGYKREYRLHSTFVRSVRLDALVNGAAVQGERTYKNDETLAAGGFGGLAASFRSGGINFIGRGGHRETWDKSTTTLSEYDGLGSSEDSLMTGFVAEIGDSIFVDARYVYYEGARTWADQAQGSLGGQQGGVENVFEETEHRSSRATTLSLNARVWRGFAVRVSGFHDSQLYDYEIQETRYSNTVGDGLRGTVEYTAPWRTKAIVTLENSKTLRDFGPLSVSSYDDTRMKAALALSHRFKSGMSLELAGSTMLTRSEYLDTEANPRDRDQVDTSVNLRLGSTPFKKFSANISVAYSASEFINIDASQSSNNRTRELYELRPAFTYVFDEMFSVSQSYGIAIEYTDFVFTPTDNFLDRNLIFTNKFDFRPTKHVTFIFDYGFNFHDNGSYLPDEVTGEEELSVQGEDRRDRVNLRLDYRLMSRVVQKRPSDPQLRQSLGIFAEQRYSRFEDRSLFSDTKTVTTDGQIVVGTRGDYEFGNGRTLKFSLARVRRSSRFGSDAEKEYWDMRSEFTYPF
ncbi:MAG: hypothetical protein L0Z51_00240 [Candidatus Latescibacteria bacterium]|nr:hypothetical protein [Candidatus Latescibacterota bacterium]